MGRAKPIAASGSVLTASMFLNMALAEVFPKPTDILTIYVIDWLRAYGGTLDPLFVRFGVLWAMYVLPCTWYLTLAALAAYWGTRKRLSAAFVRVVAVGIFGFMIAAWLAVNPVTMPMSYDVGYYILVASVVYFAAMLVLIYVQVKQGRIRTDALGK